MHFRELVHQRDDFANKWVSASLQKALPTQKENTQSPSRTTITPESNHIALEVSELKAQIRKLKQQL